MVFFIYISILHWIFRLNNYMINYQHGLFFAQADGNFSMHLRISKDLSIMFNSIDWLESLTYKSKLGIRIKGFQVESLLKVINYEGKNFPKVTRILYFMHCDLKSQSWFLFQYWRMAHTPPYFIKALAGWVMQNLPFFSEPAWWSDRKSQFLTFQSSKHTRLRRQLIRT